MTKTEARKYYLKLRRALSSSDKIAKEASILQCFRQEFELLNKTIHVYLPIKKFNEFDTYSLLQKENFKVVVPQSNFDSLEMTSFEFEGKEQIKESDYEIPEPITGKEVFTEEIDVIIVPLLCADIGGFRVGYGKGFYDRFISQCRPETLKIGFSFFEPIDRIKDINEHDQKLTHLITPDNFYAF